MLSFQNPGVMDLLSATTMGISVKSESAVGFFGTGFKYGVAVVLRHGGKVTLYLGLDKYIFTSKKEEVRGKTFEVVHMVGPEGENSKDVALGFTTELGKTWEPWKAYREFRCNAEDENGCVWTSAHPPKEGFTTIYIDSFQEMDNCHKNSELFFLKSTPILSTSRVEIHHAKADDAIFYRGIRVGKLPSKGLFSYNILERISLTEDRTLNNIYTLTQILTETIPKLDDTQVINKILTAPSGLFEHTLDFSYGYRGSNEFLMASEKAWRQGKANPSVRQMLEYYDPEKLYTQMKLTFEQRQMLDSAMLLNAKLDCYPGRHTISYVEELGRGHLGMVHNDQIYISREAFRSLVTLAGTLYEETMHIQHGLEDESRNMQNHLLDTLFQVVYKL